MGIASEERAGSRLSEERRVRILDSALAVFVANGYVGTSTDQIAAASAISKQTLYKHFADKEGLFAALITDISDRIRNPFDELTELMRSVPDAQSAVTLLAEQFTRSIMNQQVQDVRRLVLAEAVRFPHLGSLYWQSGFERVLASMGDCLRIVSERGLLTIARPDVAAQQLTGMLLWIPSNRIMFCGSEGEMGAAELTGFIASGVDTFISAYRADE